MVSHILGHPKFKGVLYFIERPIFQDAQNAFFYEKTSYFLGHPKPQIGRPILNLDVLYFRTSNVDNKAICDVTGYQYICYISLNTQLEFLFPPSDISVMTYSSSFKIEYQMCAGQYFLFVFKSKILQRAVFGNVKKFLLRKVCQKSI